MSALPSKPKVLMIGHYALQPLDSAPQVRISAFYQALTQMSQVSFISEYRSKRRQQLWRLLLSGQIYHFDLVYIEAATSTAMEIDILLLLLWKLAQKPVAIFIRDAHPLFHITPADSLKNKILILAWHISQFFYHRWCTQLFYPTQGLAKCFTTQIPQAILPPGCVTGRKRRYHQQGYLLYAGGLDPFRGSQLLYQSMLWIRKHLDVKLLVVSSPHHVIDQPWLQEEWIEWFTQPFETLLSDHSIPLTLGLIPLQKTKYFDLALPVKLMDYMSIGLPVVSTDCSEIVNFFERYPVGITSTATPEAFGNSILMLLQDLERREEMSQKAYQLAQTEHSWQHRGTELLRYTRKKN